MLQLFDCEFLLLVHPNALFLDSLDDCNKSDHRGVCVTDHGRPQDHRLSKRSKGAILLQLFIGNCVFHDWPFLLSSR